jgi:hypothetical protein
MSNRVHLVQLTPPRHSALTPAHQVEMFCALAQARRATAPGVALEIAGDAGHVRFLARTPTAAARDQVGMVFSGYYPQGAVVPLDEAADPARLPTGAGALAAELHLRGRGELPLRTLVRDEASAQLLRIIGVLRTLPAPTADPACQSRR